MPVTVRVDYADVKSSALRAAQRAIQRIHQVRNAVWGDEGERGAWDESGVVKLGFSWMGCDVIPFSNGAQGLAGSLQKIFFRYDKQQLDCCLVQEGVEKIQELRIQAFCHGDNPEDYHLVPCYLGQFARKFESSETSEEMSGSGNPEKNSKSALLLEMADNRPKPSSVALNQVFHGDREAQTHAESEAKKLTKRWLTWYATEWCSFRSPANARFDFLVEWTDEMRNSGKKPRLWTCEISEIGVSLCGLPVHWRNAAVTNSCFYDSNFLREKPCHLLAVYRDRDLYDLKGEVKLNSPWNRKWDYEKQVWTFWDEATRGWKSKDSENGKEGKILEHGKSQERPVTLKQVSEMQETLEIEDLGEDLKAHLREGEHSEEPGDELNVRKLQELEWKRNGWVNYPKD